jgi:hypothetical protein
VEQAYWIRAHRTVVSGFFERSSAHEQLIDFRIRDHIFSLEVVLHVNYACVVVLRGFICFCKSPNTRRVHNFVLGLSALHF